MTYYFTKWMGLEPKYASIVWLIFGIWNAINDPTTAGIKDSKQALSYDAPRKDTN